MAPERDRLAEELLRAVPWNGASADPAACPPEDLLIGLVRGTLAARTAEKMRDHLVHCDACREVAALLADEPAVLEEPASPRARLHLRPARRWFALAAAASVLLALGVGLAWREAGEKGGAVTDDRLVAVARSLAASNPDLFATFEPLGAEERRRPSPPPVERGGLFLQTPRETLLATRPVFRWREVNGAGLYVLTLSDATGAELWTRRVEQASALYPAEEAALEPGALYLWEVLAEGAARDLTGQTSFCVADPAVARRFEAARERIRAVATGETARLLEAHLAIRWNLLVHARTLLDPAASPGEEGDLARESRRYVERQLGLESREPTR